MFASQVGAETRVLLEGNTTERDYVTQGTTWEYSGEDSEISVQATYQDDYARGISFSIGTVGERNRWRLSFDAATVSLLEAGEYHEAVRFPFNRDTPGISLSGHGRGCNRVSGEFVIQHIAFDKNRELQSFAADFSIDCEQRGYYSTTGLIHYNYEPGPQFELYLQGSGRQDWVTRGETWAYTQETARISVQPAYRDDLRTGIRINVRSNESRDEYWGLSFDAGNNELLSAQAYTDATRFPFNRENSGLDVSGMGHGCNKLAGSFEVLQAEFEGSQIKSFAATFQQHCENRTTATTTGYLFFNVDPAAFTNPWHNVANPADVNNDGIVSAIDALQVINRLNSLRVGELPSENTTGMYIDTNDDGILSPFDALKVINAM